MPNMTIEHGNEFKSFEVRKADPKTTIIGIKAIILD